MTDYLDVKWDRSKKTCFSISRENIEVVHIDHKYIHLSTGLIFISYLIIHLLALLSTKTFLKATLIICEENR